MRQRQPQHRSRNVSVFARTAAATRTARATPAARPQTASRATSPTSPAPSPPPARSRGFTLLEVLIAIALTAVLFLGVSSVTVNVLEIWSAQVEDPLFDRHVDGLKRALEECVAETNDSAAGGGSAANAAATGARGSTIGSGASTRRASNSTAAAVRTPDAVFSAAPSSTSLERAPYLRITSAPHFLVTDALPLGYVHGWLAVEGDSGLVLYWQTDDERATNANDTHRLVLSPWVTQARHLAYSETSGEWVEVNPADATTIESGSSIWMELTFVHQGQTRIVTLPLADAAPHNLAY